MKDIILIATIKDWNINNFYEFKKKFEDKYNLYLITNKDDLIYQNVKDLNPKYIFFPHWSWLIPNEIYKNYECILFHMTDLPYGRGGSPLQNLIIKGIYKTKISAIKVDKQMDSGDIYFKEDFDISEGSAEEIFIKASKITFEKLIPKFLKEEIPLKVILIH